MDDWSAFITGVKNQTIAVGTTKTVNLGSLGNHTLRVSNNSTPSTCSTTGFSQTACGYILEFTDVISNYSMNTSNTNTGGWPSTRMRTYVNSTIYNALPTSLKNAIIDTFVVSGHGSGQTTNFTSTDKIYLISSKEAGLGDLMDSSKSLTRVLDYYSSNNNNNARKKGAAWWFRSAHSNTAEAFIIISADGSFNTLYAGASNGVSPAFRIG